MHPGDVLVHVEAPDETAHQGDLRNKIRAIEDFDRNIVQPIFDGVKGKADFRLVVCMDHLTPLSIQTHSRDPVPVAIYDSTSSGSKSDLTYTEKNAKTAKLKFADGEEFFRYIISDKSVN